MIWHNILKSQKTKDKGKYGNEPRSWGIRQYKTLFIEEK